MTDVKPFLCTLCKDVGEIVERKARQLGYTIAPSEPPDVLEEKLVPCPLCGSRCEMCGSNISGLEAKTKTTRVEVTCCPSCALDWDAVALAERAERKQLLREESYRWADDLHGKSVVVFWNDNTHPKLATYFGKQVKGIAYRATNESGGWGNVKVIIDPAEYGRISLFWTYSIEYGTGRHIPYQKPIIDGQEYGLYLNLDGRNYYTLVSWGCRKTVSCYVHNKQVKGAGEDKEHKADA